MVSNVFQLWNEHDSRFDKYLWRFVLIGIAYWGYLIFDWIMGMGGVTNG